MGVIVGIKVRILAAFSLPRNAFLHIAAPSWRGHGCNKRSKTAYDCYGSGYYQFCTTTDWKTFTLKAQTATSGAFTPRHGTVMPITVKEYNTLIKAFPTAGLTSCNIGDVNGDNILTVADANMMANYYVGTPQTGFNRFVADMNNDLAITIADANEVTNAYLTAE